MLRLVIVEDEKPALKNLISKLSQTRINYKIVAELTSIKQSIKWFSENSDYDLILMDISLPDGLSFNIFSEVKVNTPIIFTTAHDNYYIEAFEYNGIDYLLKPINAELLTKSLNRYQSFKDHFMGLTRLLEYLNVKQSRRSKILVKKGDEYTSINLEDVVYFFAENRIVFLTDINGKKVMTEYANLIDIESHLDKNNFFKVNRKIIINLNHIKKFKRLDKNRIIVELSIASHEPIIVSQGNTQIFRKTINSL